MGGWYDIICVVYMNTSLKNMKQKSAFLCRATQKYKHRGFISFGIGWLDNNQMGI